MGTSRSALFSAESSEPHARLDDATPRTRPVPRWRAHGAPIDVRELFLRAVPTSTRVLVLDLDRTIHLGRNMGELLGWEIVAHLGYGPAYLAEREATRSLRQRGRVFVDLERPLAALKYLSVGASLWAPPGLFYFVWGKLASRSSLLRREAFRRFGPEAVRAVQRVPQHALLHQIASLPSPVVRELAMRVLRRHEGDQVIDAADVAWLRARCPGIRVVISSASPRPIVEAAAELLGIDEIVCTELEETAERACAPCDLSSMGRPRGAPARISRPSRQRINAGPAKLDALVARFPELLDPAVESVGVTDTGYGEDHSWTELFRTVIDVNSDAPFPPIVGAASPIHTIHSASLLTRIEREAREARAAREHDGARETRLDARRGEALPEVELTELEILARLGPIAREVEAITRSIEACAWELESDRAAARGALLALEPAIDAAVERFNAAPTDARADALGALERLLAVRDACEARIVALERPLSARAYELTVALERAREAVAVAPDGVPQRLAAALT
jgi:hypothetical protein